MFVLGFIADPIINFYLDPYSAFSSTPLKNLTSKIEPVLSEDNDPTWMEHFVKGLASLGLLSFVKVIFALSPWQWWNLRSSGILRVNGRAGVNGRDRLANISWIVVMIGVATFLWGVYKAVRAWSRRTLEKASERVMDVPLANKGDELDDAVLDDRIDAAEMVKNRQEDHLIKKKEEDGRRTLIVMRTKGL
ncbi:hypothetical protein MMC09_003871 [Bachmanniomyces sp. S44760]|nr:hypothetical protein [Bachmanniomyces sp. S44760]